MLHRYVNITNRYRTYGTAGGSVVFADEIPSENWTAEVLLGIGHEYEIYKGLKIFNQAIYRLEKQILIGNSDKFSLTISG